LRQQQGGDTHQQGEQTDIALRRRSGVRGAGGQLPQRSLDAVFHLILRDGLCAKAHAAVLVQRHVRRRGSALAQRRRVILARLKRVPLARLQLVDVAEALAHVAVLLPRLLAEPAELRRNAR
jgi:hypothetical protein